MYIHTQAKDLHTYSLQEVGRRLMRFSLLNKLHIKLKPARSSMCPTPTPNSCVQSTNNCLRRLWLAKMLRDFFWTWPAAYRLGSKFQKSEEGKSCTATKWVLGIEPGPLKENSVLNHFLALIELYNSVPTSLTHTSVSNPNKISVVHQVGLWCNCYFVCSGFFVWAE